MKRKRKITEHQILFFVSFFVGILGITFIAKGRVPENTLMNQALSNAFLDEGWNRRELLLQCIYSRGCVFAVLIMLTYTFMRNWVFRIVTIWLGGMSGILIKMFYLWYGMKGMGLFIVALMPQFVFYWMAYGLLYWETNKTNRGVRKNGITFFLIVAVVIMGIFLESYVNPILLNNYIKIFF